LSEKLKRSGSALPSLAEVAEEANHTAHTKGWYIGQRSFGDIVALIHSEVSEAFEEHRDNHNYTEVWFNDNNYPDPDDEDWDEIYYLAEHGNKPEGISTEMADVIIRVLDFCHEKGIDIEQAIAAKMAYNRTRPYRHGGKSA